MGPVAYCLPIYSHTLKGSLVIQLGHRRYTEIWQLFVIVFIWGALHQEFVHAETTIFPSAFGSGRYDSNIFLRPPSLLPPGAQNSDFVGAVGGNVQLLHKSRDLDASLSAGGDFNSYALNSELNFVTARVNGYAVLDRWVERFAKGLRLIVSESFLYTPETPGFLVGDPKAPVAAAPVAGDAFFRGVQNFRANTFSNSTSVKASYPLARSLAVRGDYSFLTRRFGGIPLGTTGGVVFFNSTVHTWSAGPEFALTPVDSIALLFRQALLDQDRTTGGSGGTRETNVQTISVDYTRVMPNWRFELVGGAVLIEPASEWFPIGSVSISNNPERSTVVRLNLSRRAAPSFFLQPGALISNVAQVVLTHRFSDRLTLRGNVGYAFNQLVVDTSKTIQNVTAGAGLNYELTRTIAVDLFYTYTHIDNEFITPGFQVSRNLVGFSLTAQWKDLGIKLGE